MAETASTSKIAIPISEAVQLQGLAQYQQGSVVSRTLVANSAGTITLFAFAEGQGLSEHSAPYDALVQVLDGRAEITISGKPILAESGQVVLMPANQPHALKAVRDFKMLLVMLKAK